MSNLGLAGIVLVSLIVVFVVQKQTSVNETSTTSAADVTSPGSAATVRIRPVQQGIQRSLDAAMSTSRDVLNEP